MTFQEANTLKNKLGNKIIKDFDGNKFEFDVIIVPMIPDECEDYLKAYIGQSFNDINATLDSSNQQFEVMGIHCYEARSKYLKIYLS